MVLYFEVYTTNIHKLYDIHIADNYASYHAAYLTNDLHTL